MVRSIARKAIITIPPAIQTSLGEAGASAESRAGRGGRTMSPPIPTTPNFRSKSHVVEGVWFDLLRLAHDAGERAGRGASRLLPHRQGERGLLPGTPLAIATATFTTGTRPRTEMRHRLCSHIVVVHRSRLARHNMRILSLA
ncbi:hypothetical protein D9619_012585 [Psilocybe cf. subviscida]|uniref:Uncharacterized protein n=1 Tax=Psilocybe cf. subviscida TaxID=2480587 RepID=A0A8H5B8D2_9AGAR|nr:hypothetical protein D9619_012585 [Psilocybe cf. subviscida]